MCMIILLLTKTATRKKEGKTFRIEPLISNANKTHFGLILKVKVFGTRKWPIRPNIHIQILHTISIHFHKELLREFV